METGGGRRMLKMNLMILASLEEIVGGFSDKMEKRANERNRSSWDDLYLADMDGVLAEAFQSDSRIRGQREVDERALGRGGF
jgi:uncharacterized protein YyaL (SSP411 family)